MALAGAKVWRGGWCWDPIIARQQLSLAAW